MIQNSLFLTIPKNEDTYWFYLRYIWNKLYTMKSIFLFVFISFSLYSTAQFRSIESINFGDISVIEFTASGNIWVGSKASGCAAFTAATQTWSNFTTVNSSMNSDSVTAITLYPIAGVVHSFMGTTNGVAYKHGTAWDTLTGLANPHVIDMVHSTVDRKLYVATKAGISVYDDSTLAIITSLITGSSLPGGNVTCLQARASQANGFYYGTADSGYYYSFNGTSFSAKNVNNSTLADNRINYILISANGLDSYVGTKGGFSQCMNAGICSSKSDTTGLPQNDITCIEVDCRGDVWMGTRDSGLVRFDITLQQFHRITMADGLPSNRITALNNLTNSCEIHIGTADAGVVKLDSNYVIAQLPTSISNLAKQQMAIKVFPQPASDVVNFVTALDVKEGEVSLFDVSGKLVLSKTINNTNQFALNTQNLEQGIYFYSVKAKESVLKTGKVSIFR